MSYLLLDALPEHLRGGIQRYVDDHILPGAFLQAVFANDFLDVVRRADAVSLAAIADIATFVFTSLPGDCHGSRQAVREWCQPDRLRDGWVTK